MDYLTLNNGIKMPMLGFGTWAVSGAEGEGVILDALDVGYRLIDTAQMYNNERIIGTAIKKSKLARSELFITTKLHRHSTSYQLAKKGIAHSLYDLQLDFIDLLLIHEPYAQSQEMYQALKEAYDEGIVKAIGISNFSERHYNEFIKVCSVIPAVNQVESHVYFPQLNLQKILSKNGTQMQGWGSFTEGRINIFAEPILKEIGMNHNKSAAQVSLRYMLQKNIAVIPKSSHKTRMQENFDIFNFALQADELEQIQQLDKGLSLFNWYPDGWI